MILVVGRPRLGEDGQPAGTAAAIALAARAAGAQVELVGSIGDDPAGDAVTVALGKAGVGHAAMLRDPAGVTPGGPVDGPLPRLDAGDIDLGLHYHSECRVLVVTEPLDPPARKAVTEGATYHGAHLVALVAPGDETPADITADATVLEMPSEDEGAFAALVGRYAALLDGGRPQAQAWESALAGSGWESAEPAE